MEKRRVMEKHGNEIFSRVEQMNILIDSDMKKWFFMYIVSTRKLIFLIKKSWWKAASN